MENTKVDILRNGYNGYIRTARSDQGLFRRCLKTYSGFVWGIEV